MLNAQLNQQQQTLAELVKTLAQSKLPKQQLIQFPKDTFDGLDTQRTLSHWRAFEKFILYQWKTYDAYKTYPSIREVFRLMLLNPALEWFDSLGDDVTNLTELGDTFMRHFSRWGSNPADHIRHWNQLTFNINSDSWDSWIVDFNNLANLCGHDENAKRYKLMSLLPPHLRLHVQTLTSFKEMCDFVKQALPACRELPGAARVKADDDNTAVALYHGTREDVVPSTASHGRLMDAVTTFFDGINTQLNNHAVSAPPTGVFARAATTPFSWPALSPSGRSSGPSLMPRPHGLPLSTSLIPPFLPRRLKAPGKVLVETPCSRQWLRK